MQIAVTANGYLVGMLKSVALGPPIALVFDESFLRAGDAEKIGDDAEVTFVECVSGAHATIRCKTAKVDGVSMLLSDVEWTTDLAWVSSAIRSAIG